MMIKYNMYFMKKNYIVLIKAKLSIIAAEVAASSNFLYNKIVGFFHTKDHRNIKWVFNGKLNCVGIYGEVINPEILNCLKSSKNYIFNF